MNDLLEKEGWSGGEWFWGWMDFKHEYLDDVKMMGANVLDP